MVVRINVVVSVFGPLFDAGNSIRTLAGSLSLDVGGCPRSRKGLLHTALFTLFDVEEPDSSCLSGIFSIGNAREPGWQGASGGLVHCSGEGDGKLANATDKVNVLADVGEEGIDGV